MTVDAEDTVFSPKGGEVFFAQQDYHAELEDELSFVKGAAIEVINKSISGWWTGRYGVIHIASPS